MYEVLLLTLTIGIMTKFVDLAVDDGLKAPRAILYLIGIFYGALTAYVVVNYQPLAPLGLAVVLAVILAGKIDKNPHVAGVGIMAVLIIIWGVPLVNLWLLFMFLVAGGLDEVASDMADKGKVKGIAGIMLGRRIILDFATFLFSLSTGQWIVFFAMLTYDMGYQITERAGKRFK